MGNESWKEGLKPAASDPSSRVSVERRRPLEQPLVRCCSPSIEAFALLFEGSLPGPSRDSPPRHTFKPIARKLDGETVPYEVAFHLGG